MGRDSTPFLSCGPSGNEGAGICPPLKVLYVAYRHDPRDPTAGSGADYGFYSALRRVGFDVEILGPFPTDPPLIERLARRLYKSISRSRPPKFPFSTCWRVSRAVSRAVGDSEPDVVFSIFPPAFVWYRKKVPTILRIDTTFGGYQSEYPEYGRVAYRIARRMEVSAYRHSCSILTHSDWAACDLRDNYKVPTESIWWFPNPSALPDSVASEPVDPFSIKSLSGRLRLLAVGRDYHRKGIDIAIGVVEQLRSRGIEAGLTVCGLDGPGTDSVRFVGVLNKQDPKELQQYAALYREAHLLLHPARFDPSPIVTAEAAAFGTPTVARRVGGVGSSVSDGESGVLLARNADAWDFAQVIEDLTSRPDRYYELCRLARARYERELNWGVAAPRLERVVHATIGVKRIASEESRFQG